MPHIDVALEQTSNFLSDGLYSMINYSTIVLLLKDDGRSLTKLTLNGVVMCYVVVVGVQKV